MLLDIVVRLDKAVIEQNTRTGHQRAHSKDHSKKREAPRLEHSARSHHALASALNGNLIVAVT
jgi:hypothetical protein